MKLTQTRIRTCRQADIKTMKHNMSQFNYLTPLSDEKRASVKIVQEHKNS